MLTPTLLPSHPDFLGGLQERRLQVQGFPSCVSLTFYALIRAGLVPYPITLAHLGSTLLTLLTLFLSLRAFSAGAFTWAFLLWLALPFLRRQLYHQALAALLTQAWHDPPFSEAVVLQRIIRNLPVTPSLPAASRRS